jgi:hypothetical protein
VRLWQSTVQRGSAHCYVSWRREERDRAMAVSACEQAAASFTRVMSPNNACCDLCIEVRGASPPVKAQRPARVSEGWLAVCSRAHPASRTAFGPGGVRVESACGGGREGVGDGQGAVTPRLQGGSACVCSFGRLLARQLPPVSGDCLRGSCHPCRAVACKAAATSVGRLLARQLPPLRFGVFASAKSDKPVLSLSV